MTSPTHLAAARRVADAVLYEGYLLYPYRASSAKNQVRWQFGVLSPDGAAAAGVGEPAVAARPVPAATRARTPGSRCGCAACRCRRARSRPRVDGGFAAVDGLRVGRRELDPLARGGRARADGAGADRGRGARRPERAAPRRRRRGRRAADRRRRRARRAAGADAPAARRRADRGRHRGGRVPPAGARPAQHRRPGTRRSPLATSRPAAPGSAPTCCSRSPADPSSRSPTRRPAP